MTENNKYDLVVIGSGPGGYVAAAKAADLGLKTACIEKNKRLGGVCLNTGCIPSKSLLDSSEHYHMAESSFKTHGISFTGLKFDLKALMARKEAVVEDLTGQVENLLKRNKVEIIRGAAKLKEPGVVEVDMGEEKKEKFFAKNILLATGSRPVSVPAMPFDGENIVTSKQALSFDRVPDHLIVVGGGFIGLELGSVWKRLGAKVTVIEMLPNIAPNMDSLVSRTLERLLKKQGMKFHTKTRVNQAEISKDGIKVTIDTGKKESILECDKLLVAVGRKPNTKGLGLKALGIGIDEKTGHIPVDASYMTNIPGIFAIGDIVYGPALAHKASAEGEAAVMCMAGLSAEVNYDAIASVIYTSPEGASVGITENEAKKRKIPYKAGTYPFSGNGRAKCMGQTDGFVKVIAHKETDRILGVHILGPGASEIIAEGALAMELLASSEDIAKTVHSHSTFSEAFMEAAAMVAAKK